MERRRKKSRNSKVAKPPVQQAEHALPKRRALLEAPIAQMDHESLYEALSRDVMHQMDPIADLVDLVMHVWDHQENPETTGPCIRKALLSGPSGSGKTETVNRVRHYLGMDEGYVNERQCIYYDACTSLDTMANTQITGVSAGYVGCNDGNSLPDLLKNAVRDLDKVRLLEMKSESNEYRELRRRYLARKEAGIKKRPPILLLFIDEIDKARSDIVTAMNGLMDHGYMESARRRAFRLPPQTALLVLMTANFGDKAIASMDDDASYQVVQKTIEQAIYARGYPGCSLERFGYIAGYRALSIEKLRLILLEKLDLYLRERPQLEADDDVREFLVRRVLNTVDLQRGVRTGMRQFREQLDSLYGRAMKILKRRHLDGPEHAVMLSLTYHQCPLDEAAAEDDERPEVFEGIWLQEVHRNEILRRHRESKKNGDDGQVVEALAIHHNMELLCSKLLPPALVLGVRDYVVETSQQIQQMKQTNRHLDNMVDEMVDVAENHDGDLDSLRAAIKEIGARKQALPSQPESSEDDTSEEQQQMNRLVRNVQRRVNGGAPVAAGQNKRRRSVALTDRVEEVIDEEAAETETEPQSTLMTCKECGCDHPEESFERSYYKTKSGQTKVSIRKTCYSCRYKKRQCQ